ncbi:pentapeptide repeat-containing protein [Limnofasciculus baicalensis]|uniref:Pentapeptide repeat-containing protein n=1 Tax=Limnofasciculus baicalensis BBK-W-15 TaxID=2699891 RepID=A0AAE3GT73_9CYAN|nr:pentapeptide repeat-containing protein [Limnofasciculus baicalensis]MCP2729458.1 pentapeptide repeat-containing protein [Limnofasciculus baicalensis BBK-W-15]
MADDRHIALLKQGVEGWNQWRESNYLIVPDLSGADLSRANLNHVNLTGAYLCETDLRMANVSEADLTGANLRGANLRGANLRGTTLNQANLAGTDLSGAHLMLVNLIEANLTWANLSEANLKVANLTGANLSEANVKMANLSGANLSEVNFRLANLSEANLRMANLSGANLEKIQALKTDFSKAILTGVCLDSWQTNSEVNLTDVICDYVYIGIGEEERRPAQGNFAPGEFINFLRNSLNKAGLTNPNPVTSVQNYDVAIEANSSNWSPTLVEIPEPSEAIQNPIISPNLSQEVGKFTESTQPVSPNWLQRIETIPEPPQAASFNSSQGIEKSSPLPQVANNNYPPANLPKEIMEVEQILKGIERDLSRSKWSEVTEEIKKLLQDLTAIYPTNTPLEKVIVVAAAIKQMEGNSPLKATIMNGVKEAGTEILNELVEHPLSKIFLAAIE